MRVNEKVLLTWLLNHLKPAPAWVKLGRRRLQTELNRICGPRVSYGLKSFCQKGFIDRSQRGHLIDVYRYRLNSTFIASETGCQWLGLSKVIFREQSAWAQLVEFPAFSHGYLNMSGMIVFGAIIEARTSVTTRQIQNYLSGLVSGQTVKDCLKRLRKEGLIQKNDRGQIKAVKKWEGKLYEYQEETGARSRARKIAKDVAIQRVNFRKEHRRIWIKESKRIMKTERLWPREIEEIELMWAEEENYWEGSIDFKSLIKGTLNELHDGENCYFCSEQVEFENVNCAVCPNCRAKYSN